MYEDLIEKFRSCSSEISCRDCNYTYHCGGEKMVVGEAARAIEELSYKYKKALSDLVAEKRSKTRCPVCGREKCFNCSYCGADLIDEGRE